MIYKWIILSLTATLFSCIAQETERDLLDHPKPLPQTKKNARSVNSEKAAQLFMDPETFVIKPEMQETEWVRDDQNAPGRKSKKTKFIVHVNNQSDQAFARLRVECCTYRHRTFNGRDFVAADIRKKNIGFIGKNETTDIILSNGDLCFKTPNTEFPNEVLGACIRINLPVADGKEIYREVWVPETLAQKKYPWCDSEDESIENAATAQSKSTVETALTPTEYQTLSTTNGTITEGLLTDFQETTGTIKLTRPSGKKVSVKFESLSDKSKQRIREWYESYSLLSKRKLRVKAEMNTNKNHVFRGPLKNWNFMFPELHYDDNSKLEFLGIIYDKIHYNIRLENRSGISQKNIRIEYCIFHETDIDETLQQYQYQMESGQGSLEGYEYPSWTCIKEKHGESRVVQHTRCGFAKLDNISDREKIDQVSKNIFILDRSEIFKNAPITEIGYNSLGDTCDSIYWKIKGNLIGIRCRVYVPIASGDRATFFL